MESGATQRRYDTFVMTGDMIIKTTSTKVAPSVHPRSAMTIACPFESPTDEPVQGVNGQSLTCRQVLTKKGPFNVADKSRDNSGDCVDSSWLNSRSPTSFTSVRYQDTRVELDIPPDDISSDDEQHKLDAVDIDFDTLPPPPAELLFDSVDGRTRNSAALPDVCATGNEMSNTVVINSGNRRFQSTTDADCNTFAVPVEWRNSLDEAIAQLEKELPYNSQLPGLSFEYKSEPVAVAAADCGGQECSSAIPLCHSAEKIAGKLWPPAASKPAGGVRSTKSQENCLQLGNDFSSLTQFINIDMTEGTSASVEVLHYDPSIASSLDSLGKVRSHQNVQAKPLPAAEGSRSNRAPDAANNPWWEASTNSRRQQTNACMGQLQETGVNRSDGQMQECYLVCPKSTVSDDANGDARSHDDCALAADEQTSPSKTRLRCVMETDMDEVQNESASAARLDASSDDETAAAGSVLPGIDEIYRPQQLKEVDRPSASRLAKRLFYLDGFRKTDVAKHLSKK
jgi:hypothetical protein